ncbi:hypothetical protein RRG08_004794 [Elysia crispata]|uniref:Sulfatase N-terminal domain-containing protein n=1 Tax=Elysia crispata TaxID=231223 RepID=A0AAE1CSX3_9GAST|nr:hypothetical protein RRG08_004794 [Elysia crispata]
MSGTTDTGPTWSASKSRCQGQRIQDPHGRQVSLDVRDNGYRTHMVGKWHLGFCNWACTPTYRGFESFYGFHSHSEDYYTHSYSGYSDYWFNKTVNKASSGTYSAAPDEYLDLYQDITDNKRKLFSGLVTAMDDAVGRVVTALIDRDLYTDSIIVFSSDVGNNFPLRGGKFSLFEGGTRVPAFVHSPLLRNTGLTYAGIIHAVDWFPTLLSAAGILPRESPSDLDGVDQWEAITAMSPSRRSEVVYNLDYHPLPIQGRAAIRVGEYKLITGYPGVFHDWYRPGAEDQGFPHSTVREMLRAPGLNQSQEQFEYLFNLQDDPTEQTNLYSTLPGIVRKLRARLRQHRRKYVTANFPANSVGSNPARYGGVWSPGWC